MDEFKRRILHKAHRNLYKYIKQYNKNNNTNFKFFSINELKEKGHIDTFLKLVDSKIIPSFLLRIKHLGYEIDNIFVGTKDSLIEDLKPSVISILLWELDIHSYHSSSVTSIALEGLSIL